MLGNRSLIYMNSRTNSEPYTITCHCAIKLRQSCRRVEVVKLESTSGTYTYTGGCIVVVERPRAKRDSVPLEAKWKREWFSDRALRSNRLVQRTFHYLSYFPSSSVQRHFHVLSIAAMMGNCNFHLSFFQIILKLKKKIEQSGSLGEYICLEFKEDQTSFFCKGCMKELMYMICEINAIFNP